jgi:PilZ domain
MSHHEMAVPERVPNIRRWPRYQLDIPLRVIVQTATKPRIVDARGNELNEGGLAVFAGIELAEHDQVAVEFTPPYSGPPVRARCVVRSRKGYNYGLEFLDDNAQDLDSAEQIRNILRSYGVMVR